MSLVRLIGEPGIVPHSLAAALARYEAASEHEASVAPRDLVEDLRTVEPGRQGTVIAEWAERRARAEAFHAAVRAGLWSALESDVDSAVRSNVSDIRASLARAVANVETELRNAVEVVVRDLDAAPDTAASAESFTADSAAERLLAFGEVWPDLHLRVSRRMRPLPGLDLAKYVATPEPGALGVSARTLVPFNPEQAKQCELVREVCADFATAPARTLVRVTKGEFQGCELAWAPDTRVLLRRANALIDAHDTRRLNGSPALVDT